MDTSSYGYKTYESYSLVWAPDISKYIADPQNIIYFKNSWRKANTWEVFYRINDLECNFYIVKTLKKYFAWSRSLRGLLLNGRPLRVFLGNFPQSLLLYEIMPLADLNLSQSRSREYRVEIPQALNNIWSLLLPVSITCWWFSKKHNNYLHNNMLCAAA